MRYGEPNRLQWEILLYSLGTGFLLGLGYAGLMALRAKVRHSAAATAAEDVIYCVIAAFVTFTFLLAYNDGSVRIYLLLSEAVGWTAVRNAAAKIILKL